MPVGRARQDRKRSNRWTVAATGSARPVVTAARGDGHRGRTPQQTAGQGLRHLPDTRAAPSDKEPRRWSPSRGTFTIGFDITVRSLGQTHLAAAKIGGVLDLSGADLTAVPDGIALNANTMGVNGDMYARAAHDGRFTAIGQVLMPRAHIGGMFDLSGAYLTATRTQLALAADKITVGGPLSAGAGQLRSSRGGQWRLTVIGQVSLVAAHIGVDMILAGVDLSEGSTVRPSTSRGGRTRRSSCGDRW
jgi:hypothetical protein